MAVTRREYIFSAFLFGILCVLLAIVSLSSDSWVTSTAASPGQAGDNVINYGLFRGQLELNILATPTANVLYMTCVADENACAVSCKTTPEARENEVRALAQGLRPNVGCNADGSTIAGSSLDPRPVISFAFYVCLLLMVFLQMLFAVISSGLAIINATRNPTEPIFGLPGCLWSNVITGVFGLTVMMMFGIYWAVSGLKDHLAFSDIAQGSYTLNQGLGYSYCWERPTGVWSKTWTIIRREQQRMRCRLRPATNSTASRNAPATGVRACIARCGQPVLCCSLLWLLIASIVCSICSVVLLEVRRYLLERDPPPPTIKVENHSDGTIFLY